MYLLKAKKRVAAQPSPPPECKSKQLDNEKYKNRQPRIDTNGKLPGIIKICKYIGTFNVRNGLTQEARGAFVKQNLERLKFEYKKSAKKDCKIVAIQMLDQGVKVLNKEMNCVLMAHSLSRISYSVAEPRDGLLALVAKDPQGLPPQIYCHAFIFNNPKEATELNSTLGNAFRMAFCKRTLKRRARTLDSKSHHTSSSSGSELHVRSVKSSRETNIINNGNNNNHHANQHRTNGSHDHHHHHVRHMSRDGTRDDHVTPRNVRSPMQPQRPSNIKNLKDIDTNSRIKDWLHEASTSPLPDDISPTYQMDSPLFGRCHRSSSIVPQQVSDIKKDHRRRPSEVASDTNSLPLDLKEHEWFQAGVPRQLALECLSMQCEGAFIVRNSQTHKGCFALSVRGPGRGINGTYHYLICESNDGFYFQGGGRVFSDLVSLINHHLYEKEGLVCKLSLNRNNPLFGSEAGSSDLDEDDDDDDDPDYDQPPEAGFTLMRSTTAAASHPPPPPALMT